MQTNTSGGGGVTPDRPRLRAFNPEEEPLYDAPMPDSAPKSITVSEVIALYLASLEDRKKAGDYSEGSIVRIRRYLTCFDDERGSLTVAECKQFHFSGWWKSHFDRWTSDYAKRDAKDAVLGCFAWASEEEVIPASPFKKPKGFRLVIKPRKPFRDEHYLALMQEAITSNVNRPGRLDLPEHRRRRRWGSLRLRQALFFLRGTGCRPGEMRESEWRDLSWETGVIELFHHKTARVTGKSRMIGLTDRLLKMLARIHRNRNPQPGDKIFVNAEGQAWTKDSFGRHFRRHADKAGIPEELCAYCLRHGFITAAIEAGLGERQIADQVGHETTRMISHYARGSRRNAEHLRGVAEEVDRKRRRKKE